MEAIFDSYRLDIWLAFLGVLLTIAGWGLNYWKIRSTRHAVTKMQQTLGKRESIVSLAKVVSAMEEARRLHREARMIVLWPDRYSEIRRLLVELKARGGPFSDEQQAILQKAIAQFRMISNKVEAAIADPEKVTLEIPRLNKITSEQIDNLNEMLGVLRNEMDGE